MNIISSTCVVNVLYALTLALYHYISHTIMSFIERMDQRVRGHYGVKFIPVIQQMFDMQSPTPLSPLTENDNVREQF
jgi:hypothetical protein